MDANISICTENAAMSYRVTSHTVYAMTRETATQGAKTMEASMTEQLSSPKLTAAYFNR